MPDKNSPAPQPTPRPQHRFAIWLVSFALHAVALIVLAIWLAQESDVQDDVLIHASMTQFVEADVEISTLR